MQKQTQQPQGDGRSSLSSAAPEFIPQRIKGPRRAHPRHPQPCDNPDIGVNWYKRENMGLYQKVWDLEDRLKALEEERDLLWRDVAYWYDGAVEERACLDLEKEFHADKMSQLEGTLGRWAMLLEKATWERDYLRDRLGVTAEECARTMRRYLGKGSPVVGWEREVARSRGVESNEGSMAVNGKGKGRAVKREQEGESGVERGMAVL